MFQSELLWFCSSFSPISVWVWFVLVMFPVFLLLSLYSPFQLLKAGCLDESTCCISRNDADESSEGVVDAEASSSSTDEYDVFLSFRGPDTRQGFTDVLYDTMKRAGIRVFRDDDEVSIGQPLRKILHAIETSQICVPIFSQTFAKSSWCLREVARMIELKKVVMPIFYDVTPDDVKLKTKTYCKDLKMHKKNYGKEKVAVWEDALKEVSRIKGEEVLNTRHTEFCKKLVDEGLSKLRPRKRSYDPDECLVGTDHQINSVMKLMDIESPDVLYIGIHGMGGIGKTTLATTLFETLSYSFDCFWFLGEVRESSLKSSGLQDLQKQLQAGLDSEFPKGCNSLRDIKERFRTRKVLIVLDDVDKLEQIEKLAGQSSWFGSGSRIIVTTRNVDVLKNYGKLDQNEEVRFYEMLTLEQDQALQLFHMYAFKEEKPPSSLETLSREIVSTAGGLPLALKVMGSRLYNIKDEGVWRDVLERSREVQDKDVKERLRISYDALEDDQKKIFLDIACVPDMKNKTKSMYMWKASKLYPHLNLAVLNSMSLVKFDDDSIWMHDLLRDLGRNIDHEECIKRKSNRVCHTDEALDVLLSKEGKESVEVLCVNKSLKMSLTNEHFERFLKLRFLKLVGTNLEGDFNNLLPELTWFTWCYCPPILSTTRLGMKNLVVLNLSHGSFRDNWDGWSLFQNLSNLKELDLSFCHNLTSTPDLSEMKHLERLSLSGCSELREIHSSVGMLKRLKFLNLSFSLGGLPDEIGSLVNLEEIQVNELPREDNLPVTFTLPETIGNLTSLVSLQLPYFQITDIPDSIGGLVKLKCMSLHTSAKVLPESLGDLESLDDLALAATRIRKLPSSLGNLVKLRMLRLHECSNLEELPESFGSLQELRVLEVEDANKIRKIPVSIGKLKMLNEFTFTSIGGMLEELPTELFDISGLKRLTVQGSSICTLPSNITQLSHLQELNLLRNHQLRELPDLPLSLMDLSVSSMSLQMSLDFSRLVNLLRLKVFTLDDYRWPQQLPSFKVEGIEKLTILEELHLGVASAVTLSQFNLDSLNILDNLSLDFQSSISSDSLLPSLDLLEDNSEASKVGLKLPDLSGLKNLSRLTLQNCLIEDGELIESLGIQHLGNVKEVIIENCGFKLIEQICLMKNLSVISCRSLKTLPNLTGLKNLEYLYIVHCKELVEIPGLENLESLVSLYISDCDSLERLENLSKLEKLSAIVLSDCPKLRILEGTERFSFDFLYIKNCGSLQNVEVEELKKNSNKTPRPERSRSITKKRITNSVLRIELTTQLDSDHWHYMVFK